MDGNTVKFHAFHGSPPCCLAQATMDHLSVNYEFNEVVPMKDTKSEEFLKINPKGKVPVVQDGDFTIDESYAIARYFCRKAGDVSFYPSDAKKAAKIDALIDLDIQTFRGKMDPWKNEVFFAPFFGGAEEPTAERKQELQKTIDEGFKIIADQLEREGTDFLAGNEVTLADFSFFFSTFFPCKMSDAKHDTHAKAKEWFDRVKGKAKLKF